jgi:hypothetical protein
MAEDNTELLTTDAANNRVGIGTTAPAAYLDIKNIVDDGTTNRTMLRLHNYRSDDADVNDFGPISIDFVIENLGGGTKTGTARIAAVSSPVGTDHSTTLGEKSSALIFSTMNEDTLAEAARINNLGQVGIGTTDPSAQLEVEQTLSNGRALHVTRNVIEAGANSLAMFHDDSTSNTQTTLQVRQDGSGDILNLLDGSVEKVTVTGTGKVGIGVTAPAGLVNIKSISFNPLDDIGDPAEYHLHIQGSATTGKACGIAFGNSDGNVGAAIIHKDTGGYAQGELQFYTKTSTLTGRDPVQRMTITHDGNVGIGTATPKVPLDLYEMGGLSVAMTHLMPVSDASSTTTTGYVVPTSDWKITFTAPANGKIEIMFSGLIAMGASSDDYIFLGLSDNSTYNTLGAQYERHTYQASTGDNAIIEYSWLVTGLTAGTSYTYYVGSKYSGGGPAPAWYWGGTSADEYPPILIKALTVPNTIYAG